MANDSWSRQPAATRPPLPSIGTRRSRSDYEMPSGHDLSRYSMRDDDWGRPYLNTVNGHLFPDMPNHAVSSSYYGRRQDERARLFNMQHGSYYNSREDYWGTRHVNAPFNHQLPSGSSVAAVGVGGGRPHIPLPPDTCNTLLVQGLPEDCSRREVAHIFRPFLGYKDVRLVRREPRQPGGQGVILCFAEFHSPEHAAAAMNAVQGYKFDMHENDSAHLRLQFYRSP